MRRFPIFLAAILLLPAAAPAEVELTAVLGSRSGDSAFLVEADAPQIACFAPPCIPADARTPESEVLGLVLDVPIRDGWMLEALINRQDADLRLDAGPGVGRLKPESFELTTFQVGVQHRWQPVAGGLEPFLAGGVGIARVDSSAAVLDRNFQPGDSGRRLGSDEGFSASLAGGARLPLGERFGLRFEGRGYRTELPAGLGGTLSQIELSIGLSARL